MTKEEAIKLITQKMYVILENKIHIHLITKAYEEHGGNVQELFESIDEKLDPHFKKEWIDNFKTLKI